jgi:hypothetical protein
MAETPQTLAPDQQEEPTQELVPEVDETGEQTPVEESKDTMKEMQEKLMPFVQRFLRATLQPFKSDQDAEDWARPLLAKLVSITMPSYRIQFKKNVQTVAQSDENQEEDLHELVTADLNQYCEVLEQFDGESEANISTLQAKLKDLTSEEKVEAQSQKVVKNKFAMKI